MSGGVLNIRLQNPRLCSVHANVMEKCMRRAPPGYKVGIDSLLINPRTNKLVAVYWTVAQLETYPDVHELHVLLDEFENLNEYCPLHPTKWNQYKWRILPSGDVLYNM